MAGFGKRLADAMATLSLSGVDMASQMGVSKQTITNWKAERNLPNVEQLYRICRILHVTADFLLFDLAHPMSLPAINIATRFDKLNPTQKEQWEKLLNVVTTTDGPVELGRDEGQSTGEAEWSKDNTRLRLLPKPKKKRTPRGKGESS